MILLLPKKRNKFIKKIVIIYLFVIFALSFFIGEAVQANNLEKEKPFANSNFVEVDDVILHYRIDKAARDDAAGKILLVHGMGGSTYCWRENATNLSKKGYHVIRVDLPAFGYSDRQEGLIHSTKNRSRWLWSLLEYLDDNIFGEESKWVLIGHSMGGKTITKMGLSNPEKVEALVFIGGAVYNSPPQLVANIAGRWPLNNIFEFVIDNIILQRRVLNRALKSAYGREISVEELEHYLKPLNLEGTSQAWLDLVQSSADELKNLDQLDIKSLLIWGEEDSWVPVEEGIRLKEELPQARLKVLSDSYHMPMVTEAAKVNKLVINFLND